MMITEKLFILYLNARLRFMGGFAAFVRYIANYATIVTLLYEEQDSEYSCTTKFAASDLTVEVYIRMLVIFSLFISFLINNSEITVLFLF